MTRVASLFLIAAAACLACLACLTGGPEKHPVNVLLITLDTTRADRIGCYGNDRIETPNLNGLASEGIVFENAFTPVASTLPSHCSIMTGMYPARHGVHDNGVYRLGEDVVTLAQRLQGAGYRNAAFVSAFVLDRQFGLARAFEVYDDRMEEPLIRGGPGTIDPKLPEGQQRWQEQMASAFQRRANSVTPPAIEWLRRTTEEPFFLWVHYFDPHASYDPPPPWGKRYDPDYQGPLDGSRETFTRVSLERGWKRIDDIPRAEIDHMIALYDGEISFMDAWIGRLFATLKEQGRWENTVVVVVSDHGESFGEHGKIWEHNSTIFDEVVRVPLILRLPARRHGGQRVPGLVRTLDIAPTILEIVGLPGLHGIDGRSLLPLVAGEREAAQPREILLQARRERQVIPSPLTWLGWRSDRFKLLLMETRGRDTIGRFMFDLAADPQELKVLSPPPREICESWTDRTLQAYEEMKVISGERSYRALDDMTSDALRSLGYIN